MNYIDLFSNFEPTLHSFRCASLGHDVLSFHTVVDSICYYFVKYVFVSMFRKDTFSSLCQDNAGLIELESVSCIFWKTLDRLYICFINVC